MPQGTSASIRLALEEKRRQHATQRQHLNAQISASRQKVSFLCLSSRYLVSFIPLSIFGFFYATQLFVSCNLSHQHERILVQVIKKCARQCLSPEAIFYHAGGEDCMKERLATPLLFHPSSLGNAWEKSPCLEKASLCPFNRHRQK